MADILLWVLGYVYETDAERIRKHNQTISYPDTPDMWIETCPKLLRGKYEYTQDIKNKNYNLNRKKTNKKKNKKNTKELQN